AQLEQRQKRDCHVDAPETGDLVVEVESAPAAQQRAEPLEELRHGREAQTHVAERDLRRIPREQAESLSELRRLLRGEPALRARRERRRPHPKEAIALGVETLRQPGRRLLRAAVLGETARELLGRLLGPELGQLGLLVGEERARLQLEQPRDEDEELPDRVEVELVTLDETLHERDDDRRDVDLRE